MALRWTGRRVAVLKVVRVNEESPPRCSIFGAVRIAASSARHAPQQQAVRKPQISDLEKHRKDAFLMLPPLHDSS